MRIGIDVNDLVDRQPSGVCRYILQLHGALRRVAEARDRIRPLAQWRRFLK